MTNYDFLLLFGSDLSKQYGAKELLSLSNLSIDEFDIKIDDLISKSLITEYTFDFKIVNDEEPKTFSKRWPHNDTGDPVVDRLFTNSYSISNFGLEYVTSEKERKYTLKWVNRRSWMAIVISVLALVVSILKIFIES